MRFLRAIPPAAPAIRCRNLLNGLAGFLHGEKYLDETKNDLMDFFDVRRVFLLGSGKAAFLLILHALRRLAPGRDEVVIPAYTCYSVPSVIARAGLRVIPCDIAKGTFGFDQDRLKEVVGCKTLCVVSTHLFGIPEDLEKVNEICRETNVFSVEDAAQAMGGVYKERRLGTVCDVGFLSLGRGKNVACGGGGIILTDSGSIAREIEREYAQLEAPGIFRKVKEFVATFLMCIFINPRLYWIPANIPFLGLGESVFDTSFPVQKFSGVNAGMFKGWQDRLQQGNRIREENGELYRHHLGKEGKNLPPAPYLRFPFLANNGTHRASILRVGEHKGLGFSSMYPSPVNEIEDMREQFPNSEFPCAKNISERIVTLPTHGFISGKDIQEILQVIEEIRQIA